MNQRIILLAGAAALVAVLAMSTLFSGRGTETPTEAAPSASPIPEGNPPPLTTSPQTPPGRTGPDEAPAR